MIRRTAAKAQATSTVTRETRRVLPVRAQQILGLLAFGSMAAVCIPLGVLSIVACAKAIVSNAALITFYPREAMTIPLCLAFSFFAAMCALPDTQIRLRPSLRSATARRADRIATFLFAAAGISMLTVPVAPSVAAAVISWIAVEHAYVACPSQLSNRYGAMRWALDVDNCPKD